MSTELVAKKRVRAGHRASTTRFLGQVESAVVGESLDVAKITQLRRSLEDKLKALNTLDDTILTLTPEEAIEEEIVQADEIRELIYTALSRLELALKPAPAPVTAAARIKKASDSSVSEKPKDTPPKHGLPPRDPTADESDGEVHTKGAKVKLPKITLPRFNGDPVKWTSFWDSYQSAVHANSEVDKFNYLRSLLDSSAHNAIAGLTLSSANYQQAIEILRKRFGNKQIIISKHMDTLLNMDTISSDRHLKDLR